jgi:methylase of polypeptide subunit release factors
VVCANLPYVATDADLPAEVKAQPASALFAEQGGAALVLRLIAAAPGRLNPGGRLLAEVDPSILPEVTAAANRAFSNLTVHRDLGGRDRVIEAWS